MTNEPVRLNDALSDAPTVQIMDVETKRVLLTLNVQGGKIVADYDPADLSEAARSFVDVLLTIDSHLGV